jgi:hypothetical protein
MLAVSLTLGAVAVVLAAVLIVALLYGVAAVMQRRRLIRERRLHAECTARAMRKMSKIRRKTIREMARAQQRRQS